MLKHSMKPLALTALAVTVCYTPNTAQAGTILPEFKNTHAEYVHLVKAETSKNIKAERFVDSVAAKGIGFLSNPDLSQSGKIKHFQNLLRHDFDLKKIARYALGRYWRSATAEQKKEYSALFERMILNVYSERFKDFTNQIVEVTGSAKKGKNTLVNSKIINKDGPSIKLDWVVSDKTGRFQVIDVLVEGVSMVITQRSDFASVIQRGGGNVQVLIDHLKEQNNKISN